jgi:hypothetical protein
MKHNGKRNGNNGDVTALPLCGESRLAWVKGMNNGNNGFIPYISSSAHLYPPVVRAPENVQEASYIGYFRYFRYTALRLNNHAGFRITDSRYFAVTLPLRFGLNP